VRRLLLVANGNAQKVTQWQREVIARALSSEFKLELVETTRRGHAADVAREAAQDGFDVVAALGGDGTVNEVANGLAGTEVALAILPAGLANVFARSLGIPGDAVEATGLLLKCAMMGTPPRRVRLGLMNGRFFTTNCGIGFDAAVVRRVERRQRLKKTVGDWYFAWTALRLFFGGFDRRTPRVRMAWSDGVDQERDGLFLAIVQNTSPYTFFGHRGMRLCPDATLDGGLDCLAVDTMRLRSILPIVISAFGSGRHARFRRVINVKDQTHVRIRCDVPLPVQMDGEFVGELREIDLESVPNALAVLY
jgi:YegS/Rv2252/BmrU family lipid kinase